jgi:hypothetical protein
VTQLSCVCAGNSECKSSKIVREVAAENLYLTHKWRNKNCHFEAEEDEEKAQGGNQVIGTKKN